MIPDGKLCTRVIVVVGVQVGVIEEGVVVVQVGAGRYVVQISPGCKEVKAPACQVVDPLDKVGQAVPAPVN